MGVSTSEGGAAAINLLSRSWLVSSSEDPIVETQSWFLLLAGQKLFSSRALERENSQEWWPASIPVPMTVHPWALAFSLKWQGQRLSESTAGYVCAFDVQRSFVDIGMGHKDPYTLCSVRRSRPLAQMFLSLLLQYYFKGSHLPRYLELARSWCMQLPQPFPPTIPLQTCQ